MAAAIEHAVKICSWQENLLGAEMPPWWMLPFDSELEIWFERVDKERKEKYGSDTEEDDGPVVENEFAERFRR